MKKNNMITIKKGNCLDVLKTLPKKHFHTCVTSPPYWGLRDYQTDGQLGLEETPEEYVQSLVGVFQDVRRVLRDDGTVWLNLGDSYYNYRPGKGQELPKQTVSKTNQDLPVTVSRRANKQEGLKEKDLVGIPWRVAFALQADGWYLRQDIIWHKPNPMPESVEDRCTKSHEYIFLLSKNKKYFYDHKEIKEKAVDEMVCEKKNKRSVWTVITKPYAKAHFATYPPDLIEPCILAGCPKDGFVLDPFGGAGTTGLVADRLDRNCVLIELNGDYAEIAEERLNDECPLFSEVAVE